MVDSPNHPIVVICHDTLNKYFELSEEEKNEHPLKTTIGRLYLMQNYHDACILWITPQMKNEIIENYNKLPHWAKILFDMNFREVKNIDTTFNAYESIKNFCENRFLSGRYVVLVTDSEKLLTYLKTNKINFKCIAPEGLNSEIEIFKSKFGLDIRG